jgi:hypothetical protein
MGYSAFALLSGYLPDTDAAMLANAGGCWVADVLLHATDVFSTYPTIFILVIIPIL